MNWKHCIVYFHDIKCLYKRESGNEPQKRLTKLLLISSISVSGFVWSVKVWYKFNVSQLRCEVGLWGSEVIKFDQPTIKHLLFLNPHHTHSTTPALNLDCLSCFCGFFDYVLKYQQLLTFHTCPMRRRVDRSWSSS